MLNRIDYQGRLTADIELKHTQSDVAFCEFTIAWSEKYKEIETKCFLRCKAWRNTAEFISKYFSKGSMILIEGHMITEQWEKDGEKQSRVICQIDKAHFCGSKSESTGSGGSATNNQTGNPAQAQDAVDGFMHIPDGLDEELPFV